MPARIEGSQGQGPDDLKQREPPDAQNTDRRVSDACLGRVVSRRNGDLTVQVSQKAPFMSVPWLVNSHTKFRGSLEQLIRVLPLAKS